MCTAVLWESDLPLNADSNRVSLCMCLAICNEFCIFPSEVGHVDVRGTLNTTTGLMGCYSSAYRAPTNCDEGAVFLAALRNFVTCRLAAQTAVSNAEYQASLTTVAGAAARAGCSHVHTCNTATYESADTAWGVKFCQNLFVTLNDPYFGSEMDAVKGCMAASATDSSTYQKCYNLVTTGSVTGKTARSSSSSSYYDLFIVFLVLCICLLVLCIVPLCVLQFLRRKQDGDGEATVAAKMGDMGSNVEQKM